jgi:hypothetical protein
MPPHGRIDKQSGGALIFFHTALSPADRKDGKGDMDGYFVAIAALEGPFKGMMKLFQNRLR